ncbi:hypothetical protein QE152_g16111 [Popillia japonica]|uniref:Uncharacterized protein n=1 Tax=Popillia japonica TaxID=7064 RepID=A0AAW1L684_POPJA
MARVQQILFGLILACSLLGLASAKSSVSIIDARVSPSMQDKIFSIVESVFDQIGGRNARVKAIYARLGTAYPGTSWNVVFNPSSIAHSSDHWVHLKVSYFLFPATNVWVFYNSVCFGKVGK